MILTKSKPYLRTFFTLRRASLSSSRHQEGARRFAQYIDNLPEHAVVLSYISFRSELSSICANQQILAKTKKLVIPQIVDTVSMRPLLIESSQTLSELKHPFFIPPTQETYIDSKEITHAFIPGLAFDALHFRLGYGKGFYDRWLAENSHIFSIGIGFYEQYFPQLPNQPHDVSLKQVVFV